MTATGFVHGNSFLAFSAQAAPVLNAFFEGPQMKLKQDSMAVIASGTLVELFAVLPSIIERQMHNSNAPARRLLLRSE